ncbi:MAG: serine hydrolase [Candidatus Buchananbacteria bacterium]
MIEILANLIFASILSNFTANQPNINQIFAQEYLVPNNISRKVPRKKSDATLGVKVSAQSVAAADSQGISLLYEKNSKQVRSIASLTKLMTALVFLDHNPGMDKEIVIEKSDHRDGNRPYFYEGEKVKVKDVFNVMLVASANEAAAALARSTGMNNDEFVRQMNQKAKELTMTDTIFADETGLNNGNKSTAQDILKLAKEAFSHDEISHTVGQKNYFYTVLNSNTKRNIAATDKILGDDFGYGNDIYKIIAGKTGYLELAGYCFASKVTNKDGHDAYIVVLGSASPDSRFSDTKSIAYWIFNNYIW